MSFISSALESIDIFQKPIDIKFKMSSEFKTIIGGILSIIILVLFVLITIILLKEVTDKSNQNLLITPASVNDPIEINLNNSFSNSTYTNENSSVFHFSFYFFDITTQESIDINIIKKTVFLELEAIKRVFDTGMRTVVKTFDMIYCNEFYNDFPKFGYKDRLLCLNSKDYSIKGDYFSKEYVYLSLKLKSCNQDKNKLKINCFGNDVIEKNLKKIGMTVIFSNYQVDPTKTGDEIPFKSTSKSITVFPSSLMRFNYDIFFTKHIVKGYENIFAKYSNPVTYYFIGVSNIIQGFESLAKVDQTYLSLVFRSDKNYNTYSRVYKSIFEFLCQIGGIWKVLLLIGSILVVSFNKKLQVVSLSNKVFNLIDPEVNMNYETYEYYKRDFNQASNSNNLILKIENPTDIEAQICVEYFREERVAGIDYSIIEAFCGMTPCRTENLKIKNEIFSISNDKLNEKLAIKNMFLFNQEIEMIKKTLLNEYKVFIENSQRNVINTEKLEYLQSKYELYKYDEKSTSLQNSLNKMIKFLIGMRALKSKVVLNEKVDCNLIYHFQINPSLLKKYFVAHYEVLQKNINLNQNIDWINK